MITIFGMKTLVSTLNCSFAGRLCYKTTTEYLHDAEKKRYFRWDFNIIATDKVLLIPFYLHEIIHIVVVKHYYEEVIELIYT